MSTLPPTFTILFIATTLLTAWILYRASGKSSTLAWSIGGWLLLQGLVGYSEFYLNSKTMPPRFPLLIVPPLILIIVLFTTRSGREHVKKYSTTWLTWLHVVRVPVEIVLYGLFLSSLVPAIITFEGQNFDILSGLSAPVIALLGYHLQKLNRYIKIAWNIACLLLLFNVVTTAVLAAPTVFQQLAFDQPNVGVLYFPFVWLPAFVVPAVFFSHLVCLRELFTTNEKTGV